jgi:2-C-methyl-D-erythritol 4-phosphate cytidylyltransferase
VDQDLARKAQWAVCGLLAELATKVVQVEKELGGSARKPSAWVDAYTRAEGWWEIDQLHRQLATLVARLDDEPELDRALVLVCQKYEAVLGKMAVGFTSALQHAGWQIEGALRQTSVYAQHVASGTAQTAYFLVDAMRYEMAQEFAQQLASSAAVQVQPAIAALPTIAKIGMAALLPAASSSFTVAEEKGKLGARVDGSFLADWPARRKYWKARVPDMVELELEAVLELTPRKLLTKVTGAPLILVRSSEIDQFGESGQIHMARQVMATVLGNLVRAVRKLAAAGVSRFVLAADHGYQFGDEKGDEMKTDSPGGQTVELHRCCWVGRGGENPPGTVRISGPELGYEGSLEYVYPTGLGIFKAGGDLAYHHGGLSLSASRRQPVIRYPREKCESLAPRPS